jgi:HD-like signal output (HDOD) protein
MPTEADTLAPGDRADWTHSLSPLKLPVDPIIRRRTLDKINASSANAKNVATIIKQDPVLSLRLFHHANQSLAASGNESHELSHTISLLGFPKVESLITESPALDDDHAYANEYRQQISISVHAAHQCSGWATKNRHWPEGELYWPSLFHCSPLWALWHHAGEKMYQLQSARAKHNGASHSRLEQMIFGESLTEICATLSKAWCLPILSQSSWQETQLKNATSWVQLSRVTAPANTPEPLQRLCANPTFAIALANQLADEAEWDWTSKRCLRLQKILATSLHNTTDESIALTHRLAVQASDNQSTPHVIPCAVQLLSGYQKALFCRESNNRLAEHNATNPQNAEQAETPVTPHSPSKAPAGQLSEFEKAINRLTHKIDSVGNLHDVMNLTVTTLCEHANLERATISLLNVKLKEIRTSYSSGCAKSPALKNYSHTLQRGDLINKLMQKSACLRVDESNKDKIWPLLPESFQQAYASDAFFMMSLFAGKRPIALLYADRGISHRALTDQQYKQFKQLSQAVCKCLAKLYSLSQ